MYQKGDTVVLIDAENKILIKGEIVLKSDNIYTIHRENNNYNYIAAKYNIKQNKAHFINEDRYEDTYRNIEIAQTEEDANNTKENKSLEINEKVEKLNLIKNNPNIFVEEIIPEENVMIININGRTKAVQL